MSFSTITHLNSQEDIDFYGTKYQQMCETRDFVLDKIKLIVEEIDEDCLECIKTRIKSRESVRIKLQKRNLEFNKFNALNSICDAIGIRLICNFVDDILLIVDRIKKIDEFTIVNEKDYISTPKDTGYRSYHLIIKTKNNMFVELQIRTMAMDCWATLEHKLAYKKNLPNREFIQKQLKMCSDQIATTDLALENIRDLIMEKD